MIKTTPMIFNTEMALALLAGNKTQTRRVANPSKLENPAWKIDDLICVKEAWGLIAGNNEKEMSWSIAYKDYSGSSDIEKWHSPSSIPRAASRLTLKVKGVRHEIMQDISDEDIESMGVWSAIRDGRKCYLDYYKTTNSQIWWLPSAIDAFESYWECVYGLEFKDSQYVWVIDFEVINKNVDLVLAEMEKT